MRIISADSGAALLNDRFDATMIVAAAAVLVDSPYRLAMKSITEPIFSKIADSHELIVHELELCQMLLKETGADIVHLDMSFGSLPIEELSPIQLSNISGKARGYLLKILPKLRKMAADIKRTYDVDVLAIGKDSVPVRIAELTAGAQAVLYSAEKANTEKMTMRLGLPSKCYARKLENGIVLHSLAPAEHDIAGFAADVKQVLKEVTISELLNPCARGFRALEFTANSTLK